MRRKIFIQQFILGLSVFAVLFFVLPINAQAENSPTSPSFETLEQKISDGQSIQVIATYKNKTRRPSLNVSQDFTKKRRLSIPPTPRHIRSYVDIPVEVFEVNTPQELETLLSDPDIVSVQENKINFISLDSALTLIRNYADLPAEVPLAGNTTGNGYAIAILDTGIDSDHPFLNVVSEACYSNPLGTGISLCPESAQSSTATGSADTGDGKVCNESITGCIHGTHVAGIASGKDGTGGLQGTARDTGIVSIQVFTLLNNTTTTPTCSSLGSNLSQCVVAYDSDIISGLERVLALHEDVDFTTAIGAVNLSLGGSAIYDNQTVCDESNTALKTAIDSLVAVGIPTFVATGNSSSKTLINSPSCISSAYGVSAVNDSDGTLSFANVNSLADFFAPGSSITSSSILGGADGDYTTLQGTSMATPFASGVFTVLKSSHVASTLAEIISAMKNTGRTVIDTGTSLPRIDALSAFYSLEGKPFVTSITSTKDDGSYGTTTQIPLSVVWSEAVTVTGAPSITLETGDIDRSASYASGSGTNTLVFTYTVESGDTSSDLDIASTTALSLIESSIKDSNNDDAGLRIPQGSNSSSLKSQKAIVIQGSVPNILNVTSPTDDGTYSAGGIIDITVTFSEPITVTGSPTLTLETGPTDALALYVEGSGTSILTFRYTVSAGQNSDDLSYASTSALALNDATLQDADLNNALLTLPDSASASSLSGQKALVIDGSAPSILSVQSTTADGTYNADQTISITVTFDEAVVVTGTPTLSLETGDTNRDASYTSGSGTNTLVFQYTVVTGDASDDLDCTGADALSLSGGTILDNTGNGALLTLPIPSEAGSLSANAAIVVSAPVPVVSSGGGGGGGGSSSSSSSTTVAKTKTTTPIPEVPKTTLPAEDRVSLPASATPSQISPLVLGLILSYIPSHMRDAVLVALLPYLETATPSASLATQVAPVRTLALGSRGSDVSELQRLINKQSSANLVVDGIFGGATQQAVRVLQAKNNTPPNGVVEAQFITLLRSRGDSFAQN